MSYVDASAPLQRAIYNCLDAAGIRIYDSVPPNAVKPYVSFGPFQMLPEHGDCLDGGEAFVTLDGWTEGPETVEIKQLGTAVAKALDLAELVLDAPARLVELTIEQIQYLRDPDGITAHAVITVHAFTDATA